MDVHDMHCNNLLPSIRSKKWTWVIWIRFIQASITNATVLYNTINKDKKKIGTKEFALSIAKYYMDKGRQHKKVHKVCHQKLKKKCSLGSCPLRTKLYCQGCKAYFCKTCFKNFHGSI